VAYVHGRVFRPKEKLKMPSFTAKHYEAIANLLHDKRKQVQAPIGLGPNDKPWDSSMQAAHAEQMKRDLEQINDITLSFCKLLQADNPKFKQMQFIAACNRDLVENG
jgi:hypothetical protein